VAEVGGRDLTGERLGAYRLEAALDEGAFGRRYRATHVVLDSPRLVEVREAGGDRFLGDARAAALLEHPDLPAVLDFGTEGELQYLVTEYAESTTPAPAIATPRAQPGRRPRWLPGPQAAAAAAALLVGTGILAGAVRAAQPASDPPGAPAGLAAPASGALGSPVQVAGLRLTVLSVDTGAVPPPPLRLDDTDRFVTVRVQCRAAGSAAVPVSPYDWVVTDAGGGVFGPVVDGLGGGFPERVVGPGQTARGLLGFVVPRAAGRLQLHFDAELGDGSARVPLT
jgi:Domain of unknown function (DUF4352)